MLDWIECMELDICCVQETRLQGAQRKRFEGDAKVRGFATHWSEEEWDEWAVRMMQRDAAKGWTAELWKQPAIVTHSQP